MVCVWVTTMDKFEETLYMTELYLLYASLLTKTQNAILEDYYSYNLSISEIAINRNISRSAVLDAIKKGKKKLLEYETQFHHYALLNKIQKMKNDNNDKKIISSLEEMERMIKDGI